MGFNIGSLLDVVAPVIGGLVGGGPGAAIGKFIGGVARAVDPVSVPGRAATPQAPLTVPRTQTSITPVPFRAAGFMPSTGAAGLGIIGPVLRGAGAVATGLGVASLFGGNGESISDILAQARQTYGRGVTKNKIISAAKTCGIEQAAQTFGISTTQLCKVIVSGATRRRRGISAADIRRTKRTLRFVKHIRSDLKAIRA